MKSSGGGNGGGRPEEKWLDETREESRAWRLGGGVSGTALMCEEGNVLGDG